MQRFHQFTPKTFNNNDSQELAESIKNLPRPESLLTKSMIPRITVLAVASLVFGACQRPGATQNPQKPACHENAENAGQAFVLRDEPSSSPTTFATFDGIVLHNGRPVEKAFVMLAKTGELPKPVEFFVESDRQGRFRMTPTTEGTFEAHVFLNKFENVQMYPVVLSPGRHVSIEVCMKPMPSE